jgi:hypothetical protein
VEECHSTSRTTAHHPQYTDELALRAIYQYNLAQAVPLEGNGATFVEIAAKSGLRADLVERFLRQAMANHIFTEAAGTPGLVQHTAASRLLATNSDARDAVGLLACELAPAAMRALDALERWPGSGEPGETGFALANDAPGTPLFAFLAQRPERARRFGAGMRYFGRGQGWDLGHLIRGYGWARLDREGAVFVDVGGGLGTVAQAVARATASLRCVVQDLPGTVEQGRAALPGELQGRVKFETHDFFSPQPIVGADVYFFRWILHNWSDKYAIEILRQLVPALKKGARVVVYEFVLKEGPETRWLEKQPRYGIPFAVPMDCMLRSRAGTSICACWLNSTLPSDQLELGKNCSAKPIPICSFIKLRSRQVAL